MVSRQRAQPSFPNSHKHELLRMFLGIFNAKTFCERRQPNLKSRIIKWIHIYLTSLKSERIDLNYVVHSSHYLLSNLRISIMEVLGSLF